MPTDKGSWLGLAPHVVGSAAGAGVGGDGRTVFGRRLVIARWAASHARVARLASYALLTARLVERNDPIFWPGGGYLRTTPGVASVTVLGSTVISARRWATAGVMLAW